MTDLSRKGRTGLQNLGNTCYMNSAIQCLSHTRFLVEYFLDMERNIQDDVNMENVLGSKGELTKALCKVVRHLWMGTSSSYSPYDFKAAVSSFAPQFRGYEQHDSQELLSFVLDGIHEDLNRVKVKPYTEELKFDPGVSEGVMADAFWQQHLARNQSLIVDNMHGQYRSQVTCPQCGKTSLTFDPFLMLSVDIPPPLKKYEVCVVPADLSSSPTRYSFRVEEGCTISVLQLEIARSLGSAPASNLIFAEEEGLKVESTLHDFSILPDNYRRSIVAMELPSPRTPTCIKVCLNLLKEDKSYGYTRYAGLTYPRMMTFPENSSLQQVHFDIYRFIRPILKSNETGMDIDVSEEELTQQIREEYTKKYESATGRMSYREEFIGIKVVNYNNKWNMKKGAYEKCPYCDSTHYTNCNLPFSESLLTSFISNQDPYRLLTLEVTFPSSLYNPYFRTETIIHPSCTASPSDYRLDSIQLTECLSFTCKEKTLTADNLWYCKECKEHVAGSKQMMIYKLPKVLSIHLKRFKQGEWTALKNEKLVEFPVRGLDMTQYLQSDLRQRVVYDLYAVNDHSGSLAFGHYTAHAKDEQGWCLYNDSYASVVHSEGEVVGHSAYVLFYEARE